MNRKHITTPRRAGTSLLELQAAFVIFGIAISGLAPLTVMYLRQVKMLESRLSDDATYYLAPSDNAWSRKLGAAATIGTTPPEAIATLPATPANNVQILALDKSFLSEEITAEVTVTPVSP